MTSPLDTSPEGGTDQPDIDALFARCLADAGTQSGTPAAVTLIHIGGWQTTVMTGAKDRAAQRLDLEIGARRTATELFRHNPPTPHELEIAINVVEDEVARARQMLEGGSVLVAPGGTLGILARDAGVEAASGQRLTLEAVEALFQQLSRVSLGSAPASIAAANDPTQAAILLILREFMHHMDFHDVMLRCDSMTT
ncbi:MAG: hypothetical protein KDI45_16695 [Candidatus Accumulibacter sp.]|nr:hypothetical protein [Accumulibacter sp.]